MGGLLNTMGPIRNKRLSVAHNHLASLDLGVFPIVFRSVHQEQRPGGPSGCIHAAGGPSDRPPGGARTRGAAGRRAQVEGTPTS